MNPAKFHLLFTAALIALISVGLGTHAYAVPLATWDTEGLSSGGPSPWVDAATLAGGVLNPTGLTRGPGFSDPTGPFPDDAWGVKGFDPAPADQAAAIAAGRYITFSLQAESGNTLSLDSIDAAIRRSSAGAPNTFQWMASVGEDTSFVNVGSGFTDNSTVSFVAQPQIDLSGVTALQDTADEVYLRLVMWGGTGGAGSNLAFGGDGSALVVSGSVIPEPASMALLAAGTFMLGWRRARA